MPDASSECCGFLANIRSPAAICRGGDWSLKLFHRAKHVFDLPDPLLENDSDLVIHIYMAALRRGADHGHPSLIGQVPRCRHCRRERYGRLWWLRKTFRR